VGGRGRREKAIRAGITPSSGANAPRRAGWCDAGLSHVPTDASRCDRAAARRAQRSHIDELLQLTVHGRGTAGAASELVRVTASTRERFRYHKNCSRSPTSLPSVGGPEAPVYASSTCNDRSATSSRRSARSCDHLDAPARGPQPLHDEVGRRVQITYECSGHGGTSPVMVLIYILVVGWSAPL